MKDRSFGDDFIAATVHANTIRFWYAERRMTVEVEVMRLPSMRGTLETDKVWIARITTPISFTPSARRAVP